MDHNVIKKITYAMTLALLLPSVASGEMKSVQKFAAKAPNQDFESKPRKLSIGLGLAALAILSATVGEMRFGCLRRRLGENKVPTDKPQEVGDTENKSEVITMEPTQNMLNKKGGTPEGFNDIGGIPIYKGGYHMRNEFFKGKYTNKIIKITPDLLEKDVRELAAKAVEFRRCNLAYSAIYVHKRDTHFDQYYGSPKDFVNPENQASGFLSETRNFRSILIDYSPKFTNENGETNRDELKKLEDAGYVRDTFKEMYEAGFEIFINITNQPNEF
jgi:regulator of replication initiation timing